MSIDKNLIIDINGNMITKVKQSVEGVTINTPTHAEYLNNAFQTLINNDVTLERNTYQSLKDVRLNQLGMAIELETLKGAILSGVDSNIVIINFSTADEVILTEGLYDSNAKLIYLF